MTSGKTNLGFDDCNSSDLILDRFWSGSLAKKSRNGPWVFCVAGHGLRVLVDFGGWRNEMMQYSLKYTPKKTNMEPQTGGLEDDFPFQMDDLQVLC